MKYRMEWRGEEIELKEVQGEKMPVRAQGFLRHSVKTPSDLYVLVKNGEILIWIEGRKSFGVKKG